MIKTCIVGASGYTGAELAALVNHHPMFDLAALYVSQNSQDKDKTLGQIHGHLFGQLALPLLPLNDEHLANLANEMDLIFLATPHEASHNWMPELTGGTAVVMDLSGAFRIKDAQTFGQYYGFEHQHPSCLDQADLIAVPGCYPTASLSALKPLQQKELLDPAYPPIINAVSGVSGAGRKAALGNSFCEVSLQAYAVHSHRHQPEIAQCLGTEVIFTPHLGNFKRGILATITVKLAANTSSEQVDRAFTEAYQNNPLVRLLPGWPKLDDVVGSPFCDLHWKSALNSDYLVISSAIDNLLKGAAAQALQCANLRFGFASHLGLTRGSGQ
jgi:N-acetyl-gamma-glutamyl-phosphate reductase